MKGIIGVRLAVLALVLAGCSFNFNENTNGPSAVPKPAASPSPVPSPSPLVSLPTVSDAVFLNIYPYGVSPAGCAFAANVGQEIANAGANCNSVDTTATPKNAVGVDATLPLTPSGEIDRARVRITWAPAGDVGGCARVVPHPANPEWNRVVERTRSGPCTVPLVVTLTIVEPTGPRTLTGTKTVVFA